MRAKFRDKRLYCGRDARRYTCFRGSPTRGLHGDVTNGIPRGIRGFSVAGMPRDRTKTCGVPAGCNLLLREIRAMCLKKVRFEVSPKSSI